MRREHDSLGELLLPDDVYYGVQTERARQNFDVSNTTIGNFPRYIACLALIKKAAALTNAEIGAITMPVAEAICQAADEVIAGKIDSSHFPVDVFNGGGGTSPNMNINEVLANRANEIVTGHKGYDFVHPNNHVNAGQSTSDVIATALNLTLHFEILELIESLGLLADTLSKKIDEFEDAVKLARTCLQDAVPITFAQEFSAYLAVVRRGITRLINVADECLEVPMGATVVGTGLGVSAGYMEKIYPYLEQVSGLKVRRHPNFFDALQNGDIFQYISSTFKSLATELSKMARDLRLLSSGNRTGMMEIILPAIQPGSSFMPGKVNPVMPEFINQIAYQICGNDLTITMAVEGAELDFNTWSAIISKNLFESCQLLKKGIPLFADKCIKGIHIRREVCRKQAENTLALSSIIATIYGYEVGSKAAKYAYQNDVSIKQAVVRLNIMPESLADELLDPLMLTDVTRSVGIIERLIEQRQAKTKALVTSIDLATRHKILDVMIAMAWADGRLAQEEELVMQVVADALQLNMNSEEVTKKLTAGSVSLEGVEKMSQQDCELLYLCAAWLAFADNEEASEEKQMLEEVGVTLKIDESKAQELRDRLIKLRQEKAEFVPQSEKFPWWEEFERLLSIAVQQIS